jgi:hypothetical protein
MSFQEKIDKLLEINTLEVNSVNGLEKFVGASTGAIRKYYDKNEEPGNATIKKIKKAFGISDADWKTGSFGKGSSPESAAYDSLLTELKDAYKKNAELKDQLITMQAEKIKELERQINDLRKN